MYYDQKKPLMQSYGQLTRISEIDYKITFLNPYQEDNVSQFAPKLKIAMKYPKMISEHSCMAHCTH